MDIIILLYINKLILMEVYIMDEVLKLLDESGYGFLSTIDNGKPRVRPFGFILGDDGRIYFCTNSTKDVYKQLVASPFIEFTATTRTLITTRISGQINFCEDIEKKKKAINKSELIRNTYESADNPILKLFYIEHGTAKITQFSGSPTKTIEF